MNTFIVMGRLTADPQIRYTQTGAAVATFNIAVDRPFTSGENRKTDFFSCVAFGKTAETIERLHVSKGTKLLTSGEMWNDNYTDQTGVKRYGMKYNVRNFEFCEKKGAEAPAPAPALAPAPAFGPPADLPDNFMIPDGIEEELPFA